MTFKEIEISIRPMEVMRIKNVIRGNALENNLKIKFSDELEGASAIPCSTSTGNIMLKILIKEDENQSLEVEKFVNWIKKNWK